jgi:hypothetical protein
MNEEQAFLSMGIIIGSTLRKDSRQEKTRSSEHHPDMSFRRNGFYSD